MKTLQRMANVLADAMYDTTQVYARITDIPADTRAESIGEMLTEMSHAAITDVLENADATPQYRQERMLYAEALIHLAYLSSPNWPREYARLYGSSDVPFSTGFAGYCEDIADLLTLTYAAFAAKLGKDSIELSEPDLVPEDLDHAAAMCYVRFQPLRPSNAGMSMKPTTIPTGDIVHAE